MNERTNSSKIALSVVECLLDHPNSTQVYALACTLLWADLGVCIQVKLLPPSDPKLTGGCAGVITEHSTRLMACSITIIKASPPPCCLQSEEQPINSYRPHSAPITADGSQLKDKHTYTKTTATVSKATSTVYTPSTEGTVPNTAILTEYSMSVTGQWWGRVMCVWRARASLYLLINS